ncbi:carboxymuconolactone decarboxylase family protein [Novosphingobium aquae]|jgi:4-carboxymuconolactone decarboxylase|uniref:Carboxymuconolactone decarboxylase family protein n=1 Tax=Novosphingobium aquae TaxID=3133435 RepID=A0ABU8S815_9SPHN
MANRISPLPREEWDEAARDIFAYWEGDEARQNGSRSNTMMVFANHPALAKASLDLGRYFMLESTLSARQIKLIILRVAHRYNSVYQWTHNSLGARQVGISEAEIEAVKAGPSAPEWSREDRLLLEVVDATNAGGRFSDALWQDLSAVFDKRQIMDLIQAAGYFTTTAWMLIALEVEVEPDFAEFSRNRAKQDD